MAKKKAKPDFSKPKEEVISQKQEEMPDFVYDKPTDGITVAPDGTVTATGEVNPQDAEYDGLPMVVIAGRPNVGKSTLFNRLLQKRIAITNDQPGVTRDPVEATAIINDKPVHLVDTGGYKLTRDIGTKESELTEAFLSRKVNLDQEIIGSKAHAFNPNWYAILEVIAEVNSQRYVLPVGRTILQKICFILTREGIDMGFSFGKGTYGPYCKEVEKAVTALANMNMLMETRKQNMIRVDVAPKFHRRAV